MLANGLNFKNYQKQPDRLAVQPFIENIAALYGVGIHGRARAGIEKIFGDKELIADPAKFTPALMAMLRGSLGGKDAKSLKSIAGAANRYRDASMGGVDVDRMIADVMEKMSGGDRGKAIQLANAYFGPKQGARIVSALGNSDVFKKYRDEIEHGDGYSGKIAGERMAGFDGAVSKFEGAVKNLETAIGRSFDNDGKGGFLTSAATKVGEFIQGLSEANPHLLRLGASAAAIAAAWVGAKSIGMFAGGFGLKGSAVALDGSAVALTRAAGMLAAGGALKGGLPGAPGGAPGSRLSSVARGALHGSIVAGSLYELSAAAFDALPEETKAEIRKRSDAIDAMKPGGRQSRSELLRGAFNADRARNGEPLLGEPAAPQVDTSSISRALGMLETAKRLMQELGGMSASPSVTPHVGGIGHASISPSGPLQKVGSAADHLRGGFSDYGFDVG